MAEIRPFCCIRPAAEYAARVAALPYDVYSREEAKKEVEREPLSFLSVDRAETWFDRDVAIDDPRVYEKAREVLQDLRKKGILILDKKNCYYLYELTAPGGHVQTGIVALSSVDDYINGTIRKHENTRAEKERDRICHVDVTNAQTGPIFLAYRSRPYLKDLIARVKAQDDPIYDFTSPDGVRHRVFRIGKRFTISQITRQIDEAGTTYIADGHHRAASAVKVALKRREEKPDYTGEEEFNYFLSVLFADDELQILPYNRVVRDLGGLNEEAFLNAVMKHFAIVREVPAANLWSIPDTPGSGRVPSKKGEFCMLLDGVWYTLRAKPETLSDDPVAGLDVSILQDWILAPILGIADPRTDSRIGFIGGIRGTKELEKRCDSGMKAAFSMYPTSMQELLCVADEGKLMPPKSTWFEPKLRSGLFIHSLDEKDAGKKKATDPILGKNDFGNYIGIEHLEVREGFAKGRIVLTEKHINVLGKIHGGVYFSLMDTVCGNAVLGGEEEFGTPTVCSNINFLRAPREGTRELIAEAEVVKRGKNLSVCSCKMHDEQGRVLADGTVTYFHVPSED